MLEGKIMEYHPLAIPVPPAHGVQATEPLPGRVGPEPTGTGFTGSPAIVDGPKATPVEPADDPLRPAIHPNLPTNYHGFFEDAKKDLIAFEGKLSSIPHPNQSEMQTLLQKIRRLF